MKARRGTRWWLAYPTAVLLLVLLDAVLGFWRPAPARLPEQFSPAYLGLVLDSAPRKVPTVVVFGDSVLWGYRIHERVTAIATLRKRFPNLRFLNLAYEGGSMPNSEVMLRAVLRSGIDVVGVIANVNVKEFSTLDSTYRTLHPSLEAYGYDHLTLEDRTLLVSHVGTDLNARLGAFVERWWRLYRLRMDIRERLFGHDDLAGALATQLHAITGEAATEEAQHRPTPDLFLGTYDLAPITAHNVGMHYYRAFVDELCARRVPSLLFLTPTNHQLLHEYIDNPDYDANLSRLEKVPDCEAVRIVNLDSAIAPARFLDNDHLDVLGQQQLAADLTPYLVVDLAPHLARSAK